MGLAWRPCWRRSAKALEISTHREENPAPQHPKPRLLFQEVRLTQGVEPRAPWQRELLVGSCFLSASRHCGRPSCALPPERTVWHRGLGQRLAARLREKPGLRSSGVGEGSAGSQKSRRKYLDRGPGRKTQRRAEQPMTKCFPWAPLPVLPSGSSTDAPKPQGA